MGWRSGVKLGVVFTLQKLAQAEADQLQGPAHGPFEARHPDAGGRRASARARCNRLWARTIANRRSAGSSRSNGLLSASALRHRSASRPARTPSATPHSKSLIAPVRRRG